MRRAGGTLVRTIAGLAVLLPCVDVAAQAPRAELRVQWRADSSWEGEYYHKPYRFHVHEELAGSFIFALDDATQVPSTGDAAVSRVVRAIQMRDDGTATGGRLVRATGSSSYSMDVHKEGGDCAIPADSIAVSATVEPPFEGHEETTAAWDSLSPGALLIVLRGAEPIGAAFSPKSMPVRSNHRLLCPKPEMVSRRQTFRMTAKFGAALGRPSRDSTGAPIGTWTVEARRTPSGGYTATATYTLTARQPVPLADDASAATGRLEVRKTFVVTWGKSE